MPISHSLRPVSALALSFLLVLLGSAGALHASQSLGSTPARGVAANDEVVPKKEDAEAQLKFSTELRNALRGLEGPEREAARTRAIAACRAVRGYFPSEGWACSEASFRAGELLRSAGDVKGAAAEFQIAHDQTGDSPFRLRALMEIGHLERRARALDKALASYEAVLADHSATPGQRDDASMWVGSVQHDLGRPVDARRAWQRVADSGEDPLDRIRAFDHIASLLVETADLEGAAGVLERCKEALAGPAAEETRLGERVRSALQHMRAIEDLQRAIDRKQSGSEDVPNRKSSRAKDGGGEKK